MNSRQKIRKIFKKPNGSIPAPCRSHGQSNNRSI
jgi:hypothetical protein